MSGSLKRAFGLWVASKVSGLHVYANDLANVVQKFPACSVTELAHSTEKFGCGRRDFEDRDTETGHVSAFGKMLRADTTFRLIVKIPSGPNGSGQESVDSIIEQLGLDVTEAGMLWAALDMVDTATTPNTTFPIDHISVEGRQSLSPDVSSEPFLFQGALTIKITRTLALAKSVENVIERIHLDSGG